MNKIIEARMVNAAPYRSINLSIYLSIEQFLYISMMIIISSSSSITNDARDVHDVRGVHDGNYNQNNKDRNRQPVELGREEEEGNNNRWMQRKDWEL